MIYKKLYEKVMTNLRENVRQLIRCCMKTSSTHAKIILILY